MRLSQQIRQELDALYDDNTHQALHDGKTIGERFGDNKEFEEEEKRLRAEKIKLAPVPKQRTKQIQMSPAEAMAQLRGELEEGDEGGDSPINAAPTSEEGGTGSEGMSQAMLKRLGGEYSAAVGQSPEEVARLLQESQDLAQRVEQERLRKEAHENLERNREGRHFFPHFKEVKNSDRIKFTRKQQSLPQIMALGDARKIRKFQFGQHKMHCVLPRKEESAIKYLDRKIRNHMALEKRAARARHEGPNSDAGDFSIASEVSFSAMNPLIRSTGGGTAGGSDNLNLSLSILSGSGADHGVNMPVSPSHTAPPGAGGPPSMPASPFEATGGSMFGKTTMSLPADPRLGRGPPEWGQQDYQADWSKQTAGQPGQLQDLYQNAHFEDAALSPRAQMFKNNALLKSLSFDPLPAPQGRSRPPPNEVLLSSPNRGSNNGANQMNNGSKNSFIEVVDQAMIIEENFKTRKSAREDLLGPSRTGELLSGRLSEPNSTLPHGLAKPGETSGYDMVQRIAKEATEAARLNMNAAGKTEGSLGLSTSHTVGNGPLSMAAKLEKAKREERLAKQRSEQIDEHCRELLTAIAPELVRSKEGQRINSLFHNPVNNIPQMEKYVAAVASGLLDLDTLRHLPGGYWSSENLHTDMVGFTHKRALLTMEDVQRHLEGYIGTRAAEDHREATLLYGKRNVVLNTKKKVMDLLLGLGKTEPITAESIARKAKKPNRAGANGGADTEGDEADMKSMRDAALEDLRDVTEKEAAEYLKTRQVKGVSEYRTDKEERLRRHFDRTLGAPRVTGGEKLLREKPSKSRVEVLSNLSAQADKLPLVVQPAKTFKPPGGRTDEMTKSRMNPRGTTLYAEVCEMSHLVPRLDQVAFPDPTVFDISGTYATDIDLLSLSFLLSKRALRVLNISDNTELDDEAIVEFLDRVLSLESPSVPTLRTINVAGCTQLGDYSLTSFVNLMPSLRNLKEVNFSRLREVAAGTLLRLSERMGEMVLTRVELADIEMPSSLASRVLGNILENGYLVELDVSWNAFGEEIFWDLRQMLTTHKNLRALRIANCAEVVTKRDDNPINIFLEGIRDFPILRSLDLSLNRCNMKSCAVVEAALYVNTALEHIDMNKNPIGAEGCRSLFRAFAKHSKLTHLGVSLMHAAAPMLGGEQEPAGNDEAGGGGGATNNNDPMGGTPDGKAEKNPWDLPSRSIVNPKLSQKYGVNYSLYSFLSSNPQRKYTLNLSDVGERAIFYLLLRVRDRVPGCAFVGLDDSYFQSVCEYSDNRWTINLPDANTPEGRKFNYVISFQFNVKPSETATETKSKSNIWRYCQRQEALAQNPDAEPPADPVVGMLASFNTCAKTVFPREKEVFLGNIWLNLKHLDADLHVFLHALSFDFDLSHELVCFLIARMPHMRHQILYQLFGSLKGGKAAQRLLFLFEAPKDSDLAKIYVYAMKLMNFVPENCSGRYHLKLDSLCDWSVADSVMKIDQWEWNLIYSNARDCKFGPPKYVISQHGNKSNFRNEQLNGTYFEMHPSFQLPLSSCSMVFDYFSPRRPPVNAQPLDDTKVELILRALTVSNCSLRDCRDTLLQLSPQIYLTCRQLRRALNLFQTGSQGVMLDVIVMFINRTVDWYVNEKIVRSAVSAKVWKEELNKRVGSYALMPWVQPENWTFDMDFRYHEDRLVLFALLSFEDNEEGQNILDVTWDKDHDGQPDLLVSGIPRLWLDETPKAGHLQLTYSCAPEYVQLPFRLKHVAREGLWNINEDDVEKDKEQLEWWMSIEETPDCMLDFAIMAMHKFSNLKMAFKFCDRYKRGRINLQDMKAQFTKSGANTRALNALTDCFRFLDRGGEGTVSWDEFRVVQYLWSEMFLGLEEFIYHLRFKMAVEQRALLTGYSDPRRRKKVDAREVLRGVKSLTALPGQSSEEAGSSMNTFDIAPGEGGEQGQGGGASGSGPTSKQAKAAKKKRRRKGETNEEKQMKMRNELKNLRERQQPQPVVAFMDHDFELLSLSQVWDLLDVDGGGSISFEEFLEGVSKYEYRRQNVGILYNFLDVDGRGEIERHAWMDGLESMMRKMHAGAQTAAEKNRMDKMLQSKKNEDADLSQTLTRTIGARSKAAPLAARSGDVEAEDDNGIGRAGSSTISRPSKAAKAATEGDAGGRQVTRQCSQQNAPQADDIDEEAEEEEEYDEEDDVEP
ncbi:unnamed protein product [Amoebophrya sp. A25]|nr:unnamed protein product [Amoebophrya sp. A25]|eukprot:GSA25T00004538001.1